MKKVLFVVQNGGRMKNLLELREAVQNIRRILRRRPVPIPVKYTNTTLQPVPVRIAYTK